MKRTLTVVAILLLSVVAFRAQPTVVPIVELKHGGLLGGVLKGKWVSATKVGPTLGKETEFVLVGWRGVEEGGVTLGTKGEQEDVCQDFTRFEFELKQDTGVAIGSIAKWNFTPRIPTTIDLNSSTYKTVVTNFLRKKGIARPVVKIREAFRVDLEGDGVEEVVLSATNYKKGLSSDAALGDYSFVIVRKAVGKVVTDHMLEGEFVLKKVDFGAPNEYHVSSIADLNGDGKMEIVLNGQYYEGDSAVAYEMKNGLPVKIKEFEIGCGV
ncbi:MAG TPA: hypothetical protein VJV05_11920 [Pyrinomonadaceae bacterium]|nr:hypothetical protein [Pyrinomonadaceae bacterium]